MRAPRRHISDEATHIDVRELRPLAPGSLHFVDGLTVHVDEHHVRLARDDWRHQRVSALVRLPCIQGTAPYLVCPSCQHRRRALYVSGPYFACHACLRLAYSSERGGTVTRLNRRRRQLEALLSTDRERPRGMRQRTYAAILERLAAVDAAVDALALRRLAPEVAAFWR
jgi:hypothetical protein